MKQSIQRSASAFHVDGQELEGVASGHVDCKSFDLRDIGDIGEGNAVSAMCLMEGTEFESDTFQYPGSSLEGDLKFAGGAGPANTHLIFGLDNCWSINDAGSNSSYIHERPDQLTQVPSLFRIDCLD